MLVLLRNDVLLKSVNITAQNVCTYSGITLTTYKYIPTYKQVW